MMPNTYSIKNEFLEVKIKRKGAEICSVVDSNGFEFIWQAEPVWERHAPILFPVVGSLLDHEFKYNGTTYPLRHHGFARDLDFNLLHQSEHSACFVLQHNEETLNEYPFQFTFLVTYTLKENSLEQRFRVINHNETSMPVSFGGHPAFNTNPVDEFYVQFEQDEEIPTNRLSGPYINEVEEKIIEGNRLNLTKSIFNQDALIFDGLKSQYVSLRHKTSNFQVEVTLQGFPYLGIWAKPGAPFVCIEPWQGLADLTSHNKQINQKKGIVFVDRNDEITRSFTMKFTS